MDHLADAPIANILILAGVIFLAAGLFGRIGGFIGSIFGNIDAGKNSRILAGVLGSVLIVGGAWMHQQSDKSNTHAAASTGSSTNSISKSSPATDAGADSKNTNPARPDGNAAGVKLTADASGSATQPHLARRSESREGLFTPSMSPGDDRQIGSWTNVIPPRQIGTVARIQISRSPSGLEAHIWDKCGSGECDAGVHHLAASGNNSTYDFVNGNRRFVGSMNVYAPNVLLLSVDSYEPGTANHWHHNRVLTNSNLSGKTQVAFSRYLDSPGQKAFAMTPAGAWSLHSKADTAEEAARIALQHCQDHGLRDCRIILLNEEGPQ